jgi:hypothetical protein
MSLLSKDNIEGRKLGTDVSTLCKHHSTLKTRWKILKKNKKACTWKKSGNSTNTVLERKTL